MRGGYEALPQQVADLIQERRSFSNPGDWQGHDAGQSGAAFQRGAHRSAHRASEKNIALRCLNCSRFRVWGRDDCIDLERPSGERSGGRGEVGA